MGGYGIGVGTFAGYEMGVIIRRRLLLQLLWMDEQLHAKGERDLCLVFEM